MKINQNDWKTCLDKLIKSNRSHLNNYNWTNEDYNKYVVNDIIYDERKRLVSVFKEYLLWDESSDFLRRYSIIQAGSITTLNHQTGFPV
jgi:hypothetical protein